MSALAIPQPPNGGAPNDGAPNESAPPGVSSPRARGHVAFRDFSVRFGGRTALDGITLMVPAHAVTAVIGPSGCGKTTLLRSVNRLNELDTDARHTGRVELDGGDVYDARVDVAELRQRVGMVFQRWTPFRKSIYDNVAYGARLAGVPPGGACDLVVERALRRAALWDEVKDRLRESGMALSGGEQQRLCIARALAAEPDVLLLDEPTSALDTVATQRIEELLYDLRQDVTIVMVTHNLQQAARVSDFTAFLQAGQLVEFDASDRLFTTPRDPRAEAYITGRFG